MKTPKVSVLLPTYNGSRFITKAIESVLSQNFRDLELIVIDDGSTNRTAEVAEEFTRKDKRVVFISNKKNLGLQRTLNNGLRIAKGEYIARIDDDDEWIDFNKLKDQVEFLDAHKEHVLIGTGVIMVDENRNELFRFLQPENDDTIRGKMLFKSCFTHSTVLFRKKTVLHFGGYDESEASRHVEDYDLWLKFGTVGKLANLPLYGIKFMLRKGAISAEYKPEQFRRNIGLIRRFRNSYPNFWRALAFGYLRSVGYTFYRHIPFIWLKQRILKIYKAY